MNDFGLIFGIFGIESKVQHIAATSSADLAGNIGLLGGIKHEREGRRRRLRSYVNTLYLNWRSRSHLVGEHALTPWHFGNRTGFAPGRKSPVRSERQTCLLNLGSGGIFIVLLLEALSDFVIQ